MEIRQEIKRRAADIEARIAPFLPQEKGFQQTVLDAMEYSVFAGGKRLRPMLMEASYQMFDGTNPAIDDFMAAIEMIHTYSLIHDDLPAMDNDEYRRGKKTTHAVYGEAMAILAGDALLNYAFETVAAALTRNEGDWRIVRAFSVLAQKAGIYGMIGGQVVDVESEKTGQTIDRNRLEQEMIFYLEKLDITEARMKCRLRVCRKPEQSWDLPFRFRMIFSMSRDLLKNSASRSAVMRKMRRQPM